MASKGKKVAAAKAATNIEDIPPQEELAPQKTSVVETPPEESSSEEVAKADIVICAYPGTEDLVSKVWGRKLRRLHAAEKPISVTVVPVSIEDSRKEILEGLVANEKVVDRFILIPAICIPCAEISIEELHAMYAFKTADGSIHFNNTLPIFIDKAVLVDVLGNMPDASSEEIMKEYARAVGIRPVEASFKEGNIVTPVLRGNPCENVVIEAFVRKKFITANAVGLEAIITLVQKYLLDE